MKKSIVIIAALAGLCASFFAGGTWNSFKYNDICLDMGGGKNPGGHEICVVEKTIVKERAVEKLVQVPTETFTLDVKSKKLLGAWLIDDEVYGFNLYDDGTASSINSATLVFQKWRVDSNTLCLTSRSIGNHTQSVSEECLPYHIKGKEGDAKLILDGGNYTDIYKRT